MLGVPKSPDPAASRRHGLPTQVVLRLGFLVLFVVLLFYLYFFWQPKNTVDPNQFVAPTPTVAAPKLDMAVVRQAQDATHEQRLFVEPEPMRHLLEKALDVASADTTNALGMPQESVAPQQLRTHID